MKKKTLLSLLLVSAMSLSLAACGGENTADSEDTAAETTDTVDTVTDTTADTEEATEPSIDFEDGNIGFAGYNSDIVGGTGEAELSVVDYNGSKALKAVSTGKNICVAFQADALLGDRVADVETIEVTLGTETETGDFYAVAGNIYTVGEGGTVANGWSIYIATANPRTFTITKDEFVDLSSYFAVSIETDNANDAGAGRTQLYIDNIAFLDADGNTIEADTSAEFVAAEGVDRSNLYAISGAVELEGFQVSGDGWGQNGIEMTEEFLEALQPGSVIEIEYGSEDGNIWIVMPWAEAGWMRVAQAGTGDDAYINNSHSIAQVTYEQIEALCGEDKSTWGAMLQCEGSSAWSVYSVKVGQKSPAYTISNAVELEGFQVSGDGWGQNGIEMTEEFLEALQPGTAIQIEYASEDGNMWIVMPWAEAGWMRVGQAGTGDDAVVDGSVAYVTYEQIEALCGEDKSTWGAMLQCESSSAWSVYSVKVGTLVEVKALHNLTEIEGFQKSADAWSQDGIELTEEQIALLVPGSVISVEYASEDGTLWVVIPWAEAGWMRVGQAGSGDDAVTTGSICQVTYEQIAALCGDDVSTWGAMLQCESASAWSVYSVHIGTAE